MSNIEDEPPPVLLPCTICSRTFKPEVLERHVKVCEKTASKKRRVFDSFRSRVSGTELEEFFGPAPLPGQVQKRPGKSPEKKRTSKWKETHENLIATLRAARGVEPPPETVMEAPKHAGNERCPSCNRFFGPRAFDRHVEFCKEKTARIKLTPSKVSQAQERLEARTKYRAPLSMKPKLTTKEKYSPMLSRKESVESCTVSSAKTSPPVPALSRNLKPGRTNTSNFSRQSPIRSSERQRSVSPTKKTSVSNSKSNVKSEVQVKPVNQPKIKENLRAPGDLRPKTGSKTSTQEKIRSSNPKLSQLEDETEKGFKKNKKKTREKISSAKPALPSDTESIGTVDSEISEIMDKQPRNKWSSVESLTRPKEKPKGKKTAEGTDRITLDLKPRNEKFEMKIKDDPKLAKKSKQQKPQINDLSVNDESFGIFVAACSVGQPTASASKTSVKICKESPKKLKPVEKEKPVPKSPNVEERKLPVKLEKKRREHSAKRTTTQEIAHGVENVDSEDSTKSTIKDQKACKIGHEKVSKIPKPRSEATCKASCQKMDVQNCKYFETTVETHSDDPKEPEAPREIEEDISAEEKIRKKSKKWRNITEIPTEDLMHMSEDLDMPTCDEFQELSESAIWDIAAEQFLHSEEPTQSTSAFSVDSLNENGESKNFESEVACKKNTPGGDDLIVLHVTDPAKLVENDADMKLSISEPCFPYSDMVQKPKEKPRPERKKVDIVVFTASPNSVQAKITHRKRRKQRKAKKKAPPEHLYMREKTFLANDIPKAKRRKLSNQKQSSFRAVDFGECFVISSKKETEEKKKKFIEGLKSQKEKIRRWQITANSHIRFMEEFQKSIEDDLKELKNLSKGKKTRRRSSVKEFKREKMKRLKEEQEKMKRLKEEQEKMKMEKESQKKLTKSEVKKFEYFEISLKDNENQSEIFTTESDQTRGNPEVKESKEEITIPKSRERRFECFEITSDDFSGKSKRGKVQKTGKEKEKNSEEETEHSPSFFSISRERSDENDSSFTAPDSTQTITYQNSSLENIEEVDESAENEESPGKNIEIEDFIVSKPDTRKLLAKEGNFLDELFPKPRKVSDVKTSTESTTAVQLGFSADSVFDLKSNEEKMLKAPTGVAGRGHPTRILQKRMKKDSQLPQILVKNSEQKENSLISLIEMWKNKKGSSECEKAYKTKATLPTGKLPPLTNKNSFQITTDPNDSYDPFKQAERQMLALLSWPSTVDIKTAKSLSPSPKSKPVPPKVSNLETSPTSAFTKYPPNKDEKQNEVNSIRRNLNKTFAMDDVAKKNILNEKPTYNAADDWEQIFEKHFDLNRNEMLTEEMTKSVKSALDGLLKSTIKTKQNLTEEALTPDQSKELNESSIIAEALYTSTPKQNSKSDKSPKPRSKQNSLDLDQIPNTYRKNSNFTYDRITPPEDFNDALGKGKKSDRANRNSGISLSSLSFCSQISDTTLADEEVMRSNLEIIGKAAAAAAGRTPRRKYARSQSVFDERNKMLFAKTYDPNCSSSDENDIDVPSKVANQQGKKSPSRNPNPKSAPSHFYRSQSVADDRCKGDGEQQHSEDGDQVSSPESNRNRKAKLSGDSAYSSLNRRSPRQSTQRNHHEDRLSSSGSDHSLPTINDYDHKSKPLDSPTSPKKDKPPVKMSKFCHECGSKYPVAVAKFCCECGVRRLII